MHNISANISRKFIYCVNRHIGVNILYYNHRDGGTPGRPKAPQKRPVIYL